MGSFEIVSKVRANVFEIANRVAVNNAADGVTGVTNDLANHQSGSHTNAHQISNISGLQTALNGKANSVHTHSIADVTGLQTALNGKQDVISGYTGNVSVVVGVDFTAETITTVEIKIVNGIITEIN